MEILYVLIPLSIVLITLAVFVFSWAVKSGQFDDLEGPAHSILYDDDQALVPSTKDEKKQNRTPDSSDSHLT
ncbi:cbb3-type cytochrome oxidase assembly protein CcoS [Alkalimarinus sediminis]|uniref:Cbb3-type cytochrome oxidase assembly protein CcoS n=1 Tax=Alkalimarinus sediminis TaxID=1632866 RepID=A0A9E8HLC3_9ALTE|nr:cbb3-type cytochrome oxidase assembly protein CcoS [Alkalimarinus sediminis]UZW76435.1 cbb3-type cytochrome oxidase assembly protein CcoS [Alkalimarinus sediminis]